MTRAIDFKARVRSWSERIAVRPARLQIQDMRAKWASCSTSGRLCFSRLLLRQADDFQDSVIVHELLHLVVPNHGKLFQQMFAAYRPEALTIGRCSSRDESSGRFVTKRRREERT